MKNIFFLSILLSALLTGCQKLPDGSVTVIPAAPTNLTAITVSATEINLSWTDNAANETGYKIERKSGTGAYAELAALGADVTTYSDKGVIPNTTNTYRVYAYNSAGNSPDYTNEAIASASINTVPVLTTKAVDSIKTTTATGGGTVTSDGGSAISARGVVWHTSSNPEVALSTKTTDSSGSGSFLSILTGLSGNTTYYVRAYATNTSGTGYGNEVSFTTVGGDLPTLTTRAIDSMYYTSAVSGGTITSEGPSAVIARGICWDINPNPTILLQTKTNEGAGYKFFTSRMTGLTANTTYYVRAYATNSAGTAYGNELIFKNPPISLPMLRTTSPSTADINVTGVIRDPINLGGSIYSYGGELLTARGVCWNTSPGPTVALPTKTNEGAGSGNQNFSSKITGLNANTTYYLRAYATNSLGTAYGNEIIIQSWTTRNLDVTTYRNGDIIPQVTDPEQWANLTSGAWCYYDNNPANGPVYGKLYNWYAVNDPRGIAPAGYHIPSDSEWNLLTYSFGGISWAVGSLKATSYWKSPNIGALSSFGFLGLPGGIRNADGTFFGIVDQLGLYGTWYSATNETGKIPSRSLSYQSMILTRELSSMNSGQSVRCVKD